MPISISKDFADIWNRLFDHRPFLSGEIKYFIKEFEERRGDREVNRLRNTGELIDDIKLTQIPQASKTTSDLEKINTLLGIALQNCETILEKENNFDVDKSLAEKRAIRNSEWEKFSIDLKEKYAKIDEKFERTEKEVIQFYQELETKIPK